MSELPAFLLEDDGGGEHSFPGTRPALICFVKEDCPTCNDVMPLIEALHRDLGRLRTSTLLARPPRAIASSPNATA